MSTDIFLWGIIGVAVAVNLIWWCVVHLAIWTTEQEEAMPNYLGPLAKDQQGVEYPRPQPYTGELPHSPPSYP